MRKLGYAVAVGVLGLTSLVGLEYLSENSNSIKPSKINENYLDKPKINYEDFEHTDFRFEISPELSVTYGGCSYVVEIDKNNSSRRLFNLVGAKHTLSSQPSIEALVDINTGKVQLINYKDIAYDANEVALLARYWGTKEFKEQDKIQMEESNDTRDLDKIIKKRKEDK